MENFRISLELYIFAQRKKYSLERRIKIKENIKHDRA